MAKIQPPYFGLARYGKKWVPAVEFTRSRDRSEFMRYADWLCRDFDAEIVERYGGEGPDDKEYWTLRVNGSDWLLMRCFYPLGISLESHSPDDLPVFERIAAAVGAVPVGWRYRWVRFRRWLARGRSSKERGKMSFNLDYDKWILLDAEDLAETGILKAYELLLPELRKYVSQPAPVEEAIDNDTPSYSVRCGDKKYTIYGPELDEASGNSWGRATFAFFRIVNDQLAGSEYAFYAINGGNDLGGMFLTNAQAHSARDGLPNPCDWPYLPTNAPPWYGHYH